MLACIGIFYTRSRDFFLEVYFNDLEIVLGATGARRAKDFDGTGLGGGFGKNYGSGEKARRFSEAGSCHPLSKDCAVCVFNNDGDFLLGDVGIALDFKR